MRAIDLVCLLLAPLAAGVLMTYLGPLAAVCALSAYTLAAWIPELLLLRGAIQCSHRLRCGPLLSIRPLHVTSCNRLYGPHFLLSPPSPSPPWRLPTTLMSLLPY